LAGLCLSSAASAAVLNTNSYSVLVRYGDTHEFRESDDLTSSGFLDNSFEFMPPNGEAKIEMLADVTGLDLKASAFATVKQVSSWLDAFYRIDSTAQYTDTITVIGGSASAGSIVYKWALDGEIGYGWARDGGASDLEDSFTTARLDVTHNGEQKEVFRDSLRNQEIGDFKGDSRTDHRTINEHRTVVFNYTADAPAEITFKLSAILEAMVVNVDGGEYRGGMFSNLANTATLEGVFLFDQSGNPVTGATIVTQSGQNIPILTATIVIPLPIAFPAGCGLLALLAMKRRRMSI
jgi:hypothetical protein